MRKLSLIRHAVTDWNQSGRIQGHSEVSLNAVGEAQAEALRRRFSGAEVLLYSSPLTRALQTAQLAFPGQHVHSDPRLKELNFGLFEGRTLEERSLLPAWQAWSENAFSDPAPGGESYGELRTRAVAWLRGLPPAPHVVAVTHSGTIQMLLSHVVGVEHPRWRKRFRLHYTGVSCLLLDDDNLGELLIERVNDVGHLSEPLDKSAAPAAKGEVRTGVKTDAETRIDAACEP